MDLRVERESRNLSRHELAEMAGVTYSTIATMERGGEPRGGNAEAARVWDALGQPALPSAEITPTDVVIAVVNGEEVMLRVLECHEHNITGTEMLHYTGKSFNDAINAGAQSVQHRGVTYLLRHRRTVKRTAITRHWVNL